MNFIFIILMILAAMVVIGIICIYLGLKIKKIVDCTINKSKKRIPAVIYWLTFCVLIAVMIYTRTFLVGIILYSTMIFVLSDIIGFVLKKLVKNVKFRKILSKVYLNGLSVIILSFIVSLYSLYCSCMPINVNYNVDISKDTNGIKIVMLSDIHFGTATFEKDLDKMIKNVNNYSADIIVLCGDIFDESTKSDEAEKLCNAFKNFKSKYGTYFIDGNHDKSVKTDYVQLLKNNNVNVMIDDVVLIDDSFYIVGRKDASVTYARKNISELTADIDKTKPIILLDHQPTDTQSAKDAGIDLQLSGHTHGGQIWPIHYISAMVNDVNYGMVTDDDYNVIVSSGYGIWGFPLRLGTRSELVYIEVN